MRGLCALLIMLAGAASADPLPALFDVTGLNPGQTLEVTRYPGGEGDVLGQLPAGAKAVEVVWITESGGDALVNLGEVSGYVRLGALTEQAGPAWDSLAAPLRCAGTEPFWRLEFDPDRQALSLSTPETEATVLDLRQSWHVAQGPAVGLRAEGGALSGLAVVRGAICSDGMSDRAYGLGVELFLSDGAAYAGCCSIAPP